MPGPEYLVTEFDSIFNYGHDSLVTNRTIKSGRWEDTTIWSLGAIPTSSDVVSIEHRVRPSTTVPTTGAIPTIIIAENGKIITSQDASSTISVNHLFVLEGGQIFVDYSASASNTFRLRIGGGTLHANDFHKYGNGMVCFGIIRFRGRPLHAKAIRINNEVAVGNSTVTLREPATGWRAGDIVLITGGPLIPVTRFSQELLTISSISSDLKTITFTGTFANAHQGGHGSRNGNLVLRTLAGVSAEVPGRYEDRYHTEPWLHEAYTENDTSTDRIDFLPHAVNLTRTVTIDSLDTSTTAKRGHVMLTDGTVGDIQYTAFTNLGRTTTADLDDVTNHIGRYPVHFHHLHDEPVWHTSPPRELILPHPSVGPIVSGITVPTTTSGPLLARFSFIGNVVEDRVTTPGTNLIKWPITVHDTRHLEITHNTCYNWGGAGITVEDPGAQNNLFLENIVCCMQDGRLSTRDWGSQGTGYTFWGELNYIYGNVACNCASWGFQFICNLNVFSQFERTEVHYCNDGMEIWYAFGGLIRDFTVWATTQGGMFLNYQCANLIWDGYVARADGSPAVNSLGWSNGDYDAARYIMRNFDIQGYSYGFEVPMKQTTFSLHPAVFELRYGEFLAEDFYLRNRLYDVRINAPHGGGTGSAPSVGPARFVLRRFKYGPAIVGRLGKIWTNLPTDPQGAQNLFSLQQYFLEDHDLAANPVSYQLYFREQAGSAVMLPNEDVDAGRFGSPDPGKTNTFLLANWKWNLSLDPLALYFWNFTVTARPDVVNPHYYQGPLFWEPNDGLFWKPVVTFGEISPTSAVDGETGALGNLNILGLVREL